MSGLKKLSDKYFVKEDDGYRVNKTACKETATSVVIDTAMISTLIVGGLAVIGLATIGVQTIKVGASTVSEGFKYVAELFSK